MKVNVGGIDRILRILVGVVLVVLAATGQVGWWGGWACCHWPRACSGFAPRTRCWASIPVRSSAIECLFFDHNANALRLPPIWLVL